MVLGYIGIILAIIAVIFIFKVIKFGLKIISFVILSVAIIAATWFYIFKPDFSTIFSIDNLLKSQTNTISINKK